MVSVNLRLFIVAVLIALPLCDQYSYAVVYQLLPCQGSWQSSYCREQYLVNTAIYLKGGPFNNEYFFCSKGFEDYLTQTYLFSKNGTQNANCLCYLDSFYNGKKVSTCLKPNEDRILTQMNHPGFEKYWTSNQLCAFIPDHPSDDKNKDNHPSTSDSDLGLILGIVGGVLVIGIVVGVVIFRRRKMANQQQYQRFDNQQQTSTNQ